MGGRVPEELMRLAKIAAAGDCAGNCRRGAGLRAFNVLVDKGVEMQPGMPRTVVAEQVSNLLRRLRGTVVRKIAGSAEVGQPSSASKEAIKARNAFWSPIWNPIRNPINNPIYNPIWNPINNPINNPIYGPIYRERARQERRELAIAWHEAEGLADEHMSQEEAWKVVQELYDTPLHVLFENGGPLKNDTVGNVQKLLTDLQKHLERPPTLLDLMLLIRDDPEGDWVVYVGMSGRQLKEECLRWLTARGAPPGDSKARNRPVLQLKNGDFITMAQARNQLNFVSFWIWSHPVRDNAGQVEDLIQAVAHYELRLPLGRRLWRDVAKGCDYTKKFDLNGVFLTIARKSDNKAAWEEVEVVP